MVAFQDFVKNTRLDQGNIFIYIVSKQNTAPPSTAFLRLIH